jgi:hypothetical protein
MSETIILRPTSDLESSLEQYPGADHYSLIDEETLDITDYVYASYAATSQGRELYGFSAPVAAVGIIENLTIFFVVKASSSAGQYARTVVNIGGTNYNGAIIEPTPSYVLHNTSYNLNPATGVAWTWAEVTALVAGYYLSATSNGTCSCAQLYVEVTFRQVSARRVSLIGPIW